MCETRIYYIFILCVCCVVRTRGGGGSVAEAEKECTGMLHAAARAISLSCTIQQYRGIHVFSYQSTFESCEVRIPHGKFSSLWSRACALGFGFSSRLFPNIAKKRLTRFLTPLTLLLTFVRVFTRQHADAKCIAPTPTHTH